MSQINDIALVAQVVVFKNTRAFDTLVKKYQSPIRRFFLHQTLGDTELSDDLAQETFIKAYTNLASFKNLSSFSSVTGSEDVPAPEPLKTLSELSEDEEGESIPWPSTDVPAASAFSAAWLLYAGVTRRLSDSRGINNFFENIAFTTC